MRYVNRVKLVYRSFSKRLFISVLLFCINFVSFYMVDTVGTRYFTSWYALDKITAMFQEDVENVNYVKAVGKNDTRDDNIQLSEYICSLPLVRYSGFFINGVTNDLLTDKSINIVIADKHLADMGKLKLSQEQKDTLGNVREGYQPVLLGSSYKGSVQIGEVFTVSVTEEKDCIVAGFLEKGAAWPRRGRLFNRTDGGEKYVLDKGGILLTENFEAYDTSVFTEGIMEYYYVTETGMNDTVSRQVMEYAVQNDMTAGITNIGEVIERQQQENGVIGDKDFFAMVTFIILALISMSGVSVVYCLLNKKRYGVMLISGMKKREIISLIYLYNGFLFASAFICVWIVRQYEIFGKVVISEMSESTGLLLENNMVSHMYIMPCIIIVMLVVMLVITSVIPDFIIRKMKPVEMLFEKE